MDELKKLEGRFKELAGKPKSKDEIEEVLKIAKELEILRSKEVGELLLELTEKGLVVSSIWDLVNTKKSYPNAIPILIKHLPRNYHDKNKEGIIRSLAVKEAIGKVGAALIAEYHKIPREKSNLRWVIGNTMFITITKDDVESVLSIVQDKENGTSRRMFVAALGKVKHEKVEDILVTLLDDEEVAPQALDALGRLKSKRAKEKIVLLTNHSNALIKTEAKKALKKIV